MGYQRDDRYGGDNRWRDRDEGRLSERGAWDRDRDYGRGESGRSWEGGRREEMGWGPGSGGRGGDDRGFFERAGEQVRSWFSDDDDDRSGGRERNRERDHQEGGGSYGWMSGGFGNQSGESWNRDRPGRDGWFTDSVGGERGQRLGGQGYRGGQRPEMFEGTGLGGGYGDRDSTRYSAGRSSGGRGGDIHDPHYSEWRQRQIEDLDRDYEEYRREHQSKFEREFGGWREKRQGQRQLLGKVSEHMEVVGSDGQHIGTVDKVERDRIILAKSDPNAGGMHHSIPCSWVENVDEKVSVNKTADEAIKAWRDEEGSRALFERRESGGEGPHMLNRSFSGTYSDRDS